mmetsp:Transcript_4497/g.7584  ORF Transcript_4497/g.7584 Transcript_4497/m.7584 type:complete len:111 (-) Transcript_4497:1611-1943(-)
MSGQCSNVYNLSALSSRRKKIKVHRTCNVRKSDPTTHSGHGKHQTLAFLAVGSSTWLPLAAIAAYASSCTPATERPEGSSLPAQLASHSAAVAVEQATEGPPGTVSAAAF